MIITSLNLEDELGKNVLRSLYLFYGEDKYSQDIIIKKIKKLFGTIQKGINYINLDEANLKELISNIETPPFFSRKKLIIVKNSGLFKKDDEKPSRNVDIYANYIDENIKSINDSVVLIFIEESISKNVLYNSINKNGYVCDFAPLKINQVISKLQNIIKLYGVKSDYNDLLYLCEISGTDMQNLLNEIRKLIEYVGDGGIITRDIIKELAVKQSESIIFDLTDSLGNKQINKSLEILKELVKAKEPIQKIFIILYNHIKKLYIVKLAKKEKKNIAECLQLKPNHLFLVKKYSSQAELFEEEKLRRVLESFINLNFDSKKGFIDLQSGLESIICRYF